MRIDEKPVPSAFQILRNAFAIAEERNAGVPALTTDEKEAFLTFYISRADADPAQFETRKPSLTTSVTNNMRDKARQRLRGRSRFQVRGGLDGYRRRC